MSRRRRDSENIFREAELQVNCSLFIITARRRERCQVKTFAQFIASEFTLCRVETKATSD